MEPNQPKGPLPQQTPPVPGPPGSDGPIPAPLPENPVMDPQQDTSKENRRSRSKKNSLRRSPNLFEAENIARSRTSEFMLRFLANIAINTAIRARNPLRQNRAVKEAEFDYMDSLWRNYTSQILLR